MGLAIVAGASAEGPTVDRAAHARRTAELQRWLAEVQGADGADVATGAIQQAKSALDVAAKPEENSQAAARAQSIAEAALVLAERQLARQDAAKALIEVEERLANIKERADAQRRVLEALMRERATLALAAETER